MPTTGAFDNSRNGPFRGSRFWKFPPLRSISCADLRPPANPATTTATSRRR